MGKDYMDGMLELQKMQEKDYLSIIMSMNKMVLGYIEKHQVLIWQEKLKKNYWKN